MTVADVDRQASPNWTVARLKGATTRDEAADYFADYWNGWIAAPIGATSGHAWTQMTLACLTLESSAYHYRNLVGWGTERYRGGPVCCFKPGQLFSGRAFGKMFVSVFDPADIPTGITGEDLADVIYSVFRCGLAHRGLSKNDLSSNWLGVIEGHPDVFRILGPQSNGQSVISVAPSRFADRVVQWCNAHIVRALADGTRPNVDDAFRSWCNERWDIPATQWTF